MINKEETMDMINDLWAKAKAHKKISKAVAVVVVVLIISAF